MVFTDVTGMFKEEKKMLEIVAGEKGKGKTRVLINKANDAVKISTGNIVYMDQNNKHMYELSNRVRLINVPAYHIDSPVMFLGFLYGVLSQDHSLSQIYIDNFFSTSNTDEKDLETIVDRLLEISEEYEVDFTLSVAMNKDNLSEKLQEYVKVSL